MEWNEQNEWKERNDFNADRVPLWFTNLQHAMLSGLGVMSFPQRFELNAVEVVDDGDAILGKRRTVDIWWLSDDGGLTLLMGHLLTKRDRFKADPKTTFLVSTNDAADEINATFVADFAKKKSYKKESRVRPECGRAGTARRGGIIKIY